MPPRLPFLSGAKASNSFLSRLARPFTTTPIQSQGNPTRNLLNLVEPRATSSTDGIRRIIDTEKTKARIEKIAAQRSNMLAELRARKISDDYLRQMPRRWKVGDVYAPHDLSPVEMAKWKSPRRPNTDVVDILGIRPVDMYKNFSMISEYVTEMGQIKSARKTALRPRNQRQMAKAIRRAIGLGIHPSVHHHPELIRKRFLFHETRS